MLHIILKEDAYQIYKDDSAYKSIPIKFLKEFQGEKIEVISREDNGNIIIRHPLDKDIEIKLYPKLFTFKVNYTKFIKAVTKDDSIVEDIKYFGKRELKKEGCETTEEFPIKGTINGKVFWWSIDGRIDPVNGTNSDKDIVSNIWYTYFMKCRNGSLYAGITTNIEKRQDQHNGLIPGGAKYTKANRPVRLAYYEVNKSMSEAGKRENVIRRLTSAKKKEMVAEYNLIRR